MRRFTALTRDHVGIPRSSIIPIAFSSNCVIHPASLLFIDFFLCRASRVPVSEPPAIEKLKVVQAMSSAIVDQSAAILTCHFSKFISSLHVSTFPSGLPPVQSLRRSSQGSVALASSPSVSAFGGSHGVADLVSNFCAPCSTSASSAPSVTSLSRVAAVAPPSASPVRSSDRLRVRPPSNYRAAVGGLGF